MLKYINLTEDFGCLQEEDIRKICRHPKLNFYQLLLFAKSVLCELFHNQPLTVNLLSILKTSEGTSSLNLSKTLSKNTFIAT
jgi:hypothetical protein